MNSENQGKYKNALVFLFFLLFCKRIFKKVWFGVGLEIYFTLILSFLAF